MASSSPSRNWRYDVFPSFSGEDVRVTFLSHFLNMLDRKAIIAFKDNEIERSQSLDPELKQAIRDSRIAVVVFSKNYASSSWCLNELLEIVKCKKEFGQLVIPVFYGLDPSHVRKQTGDFGKIFEKTCHNKTEDVKSQWQKALTDVANILGFHSGTWGNEAEMVEKIADDVLGKLLKAPENDFEDFVGMEDHIAKMTVLLQLESEEVKMVGIWGSSGIGKTTIARVLFNRLRTHFQGSIFIDKVFIFKIKGSYGKANLDDYNIKLHLQRSFLSEILGQRDLKIDNLGAIKERIRNRKVLICIDDLDDAMVLDALVGETQWFGSGSRIIVNTTNKHLLMAHGIDCIHVVGLPSEEVALEIFCRSAYRKNSPPEGFEKFAVEAVRSVGFLPLGLKVLGSSLRGRDKEDWKKMLRPQSGLHGSIGNTLRFSYDGLDENEDLVGMEDHIGKMTVLLQLESEEVKMVGIWGASGIGKTTIARVLYNRLRPHFQGSVFIDKVFISHIKESYGKANLDDYNIKLHLQRTFLSLILGLRDYEIDHLGAIKERLRNRKVLICIDDLDDAMVLDALVGETQWFGSGSRIIVNTTNKHLLKAHGIDCIHEVGLPSEELALEIFCRSAFRKNSPPEGFEELAVEAVRSVGFLPLGLKVLGSSLRGRDKEYWEIMFSKFQNNLDGKIEKVLRISYDALDEEEQVIFRHIACLFNLEKVDDIKLLLADSGLNVEFCLRNLVDKAILNIRSGIVDMSPLIQQVGQDMVRKQSNYEPGEREFLVNLKDIRDVLENNTGTKKVIGISLNIDDQIDPFLHIDAIEELRIHENAFKGMDNLRFLKFFSNRYMPEKRVRLHLPDSFDHLPPKLKLLYWDGYPMKRMPSNFNPSRLVKLKMENSNLRMLWEGSRKLTCLKEINLWGSENLKEIPDLSMATHLEKLYVGHCLSWVARPSSIRKFNELTELGMLECRNLDTLPTDINLESPKCLSLTGVKGERLRQGMQPLIGKVTTLPDSLMVLLLTDIPNMVELPFSIKNLNNLTDLRITRCTNLVTLPTGINLESLERLNLNGCSRLRTFPDISRNISSLYLDETAIEVVPRCIENFSKLKYLVMQRCSKLEYVHLNISKLKHLEWVNFSYCGALAGADLTGYPNGLSIEEDDAGTKLPALEEASSSHPDNVVPKVDFSFINCFNLDQEVLFQQLSLEKLVLSGKELPLYFTHKTTGTSLAISLLESPLSPPFFRFKACVVVVFNSKPTFAAIGVSMKVTCRFKGKLGNHFDYPFEQEYFSVQQKGSHLFLLDCCMPLKEDDALLAEVNYDQVDIQCHMSSGNSKFKLKEWGIRLSRDGSSPENRLDKPVSLPRLCEAMKTIGVNE